MSLMKLEHEGNNWCSHQPETSKTSGPHCDHHAFRRYLYGDHQLWTTPQCQLAAKRLRRESWEWYRKIYKDERQLVTALHFRFGAKRSNVAKRCIIDILASRHGQMEALTTPILAFNSSHRGGPELLTSSITPHLLGATSGRPLPHPSSPYNTFLRDLPPMWITLMWRMMRLH